MSRLFFFPSRLQPKPNSVSLESRLRTHRVGENCATSEKRTYTYKVACKNIK